MSDDNFNKYLNELKTSDVREWVNWTKYLDWEDYKAQEFELKVEPIKN
jgi:hypothetical protein